MLEERNRAVGRHLVSFEFGQQSKMGADLATGNSNIRCIVVEVNKGVYDIARYDNINIMGKNRSCLKQ